MGVVGVAGGVSRLVVWLAASLNSYAALGYKARGSKEEIE